MPRHVVGIFLFVYPVLVGYVKQTNRTGIPYPNSANMRDRDVKLGKQIVFYYNQLGIILNLK